MYDVDYFIKKFEAIPEELFCIGAFKDGAKRCTNGHCGMLSEFEVTPELEQLKRLLAVIPLHEKYVPCEIPDREGSYSLRAACINDGRALEYQQPTPKQRILAALHDIKKLQNKEWVDKTIESIPEEKELAK
jgi:hypothetical protein